MGQLSSPVGLGFVFRLIQTPCPLWLPACMSYLPGCGVHGGQTVIKSAVYPVIMIRIIAFQYSVGVILVMPSAQTDCYQAYSHYQHYQGNHLIHLNSPMSILFQHLISMIDFFHFLVRNLL